MRNLGPDTDLPVFYMYPKFLLGMNLNETARTVYMLLFDRARLSIQNGWLDQDGGVFLYYTEEHLATDMNRTESTIRTALRRWRGWAWSGANDRERESQIVSMSISRKRQRFMTARTTGLRPQANLRIVRTRARTKLITA